METERRFALDDGSCKEVINNLISFRKSVISVSIYHRIVLAVAYALSLLHSISNVTLAMFDSTSSIYYKMFEYRSKHNNYVS